MPTNQEFSDLLDKTSTNESNFSNGILTINDHPSLFFPAAGYGYGAQLYSAGSYGYYWSSSLGTGNPCDAVYLYFTNVDVNPSTRYRNYGHPVRPVSVSN